PWFGSAKKRWRQFRYPEDILGEQVARGEPNRMDGLCAQPCRIDPDTPQKWHTLRAQKFTADLVLRLSRFFEKNNIPPCPSKGDRQH
ncbi:MAG: hypothetical protein WA826_10240, partial [Silvibacterium sp.]